ncbi:hypothetical protein E1265_18950 [Streptomyces sp. 8K308]|uniref:hypothetical protein n=1 Tax=Streptomyces sp. 8K308 TaxID=2530388 RepID=UPI00104B2DA2|nr:hypothetical protein [Streptomyces sp. 8K308]TDC21085.1 hypothetical protein E1265_18950 [Streptomyces sp. 8K308]
MTIALVFFVFAQAAVLRSGGQSGADAAALAATTEARDQLYERFLDAIEDEGEDEDALDEILSGMDFETGSACGAADRLATRNDATVGSCDPHETGYLVTVTTTDTLGDTVIPGTDGSRATARGRAVIEGLCRTTTKEADRIELDCEERRWEFDPGNEDELPEARDLYRVYLED